jgi:putative hemolysin
MRGLIKSAPDPRQSRLYVELAGSGIRTPAVMDDQRLALPEVPACDPQTVKTPLPPLLKAYIRVGALVARDGCFDPDVNVADVLVVIDLNTTDEAYARRCLQRTTEVEPR